MKDRSDVLSAEDIGLIAAILVLVGDVFAVWALLKARKEEAGNHK
ncbi:hypothetical protein [Paenibacillus harenae]|nr:hypothetical protein [Paenibacillus harenae]